MQYTVILEKEPATDWGAWVPDLPGCVATAKTREETNKQSAISYQLSADG